MKNAKENEKRAVHDGFLLHKNSEKTNMGNFFQRYAYEENFCCELETITASSAKYK